MKLALHCSFSCFLYLKLFEIGSAFFKIFPHVLFSCVILLYFCPSGVFLDTVPIFCTFQIHICLNVVSTASQKKQAPPLYVFNIVLQGGLCCPIPPAPYIQSWPTEQLSGFRTFIRSSLCICVLHVGFPLSPPGTCQDFSAYLSILPMPLAARRPLFCLQ